MIIYARIVAEAPADIARSPAPEAAIPRAPR